LLDPRFGLCHRGTSGGHRLWRNQRRGQSCTLPFRFSAACLQAGAALFELLSAPLQRDAARVGRGNGFGLSLQHRLRLGQASARFPQPSFGELSTRAFLRLGPGERVLLFGQPGQRRLGLGQVGFLAFEIGGELREPPFRLGASGEHPLQLLFERAARVGQPLQFGGGRGFSRPKGRQRRLGRVASPYSGNGVLGRLGNGPLRCTMLGGTPLGLCLCCHPAGVEQQRLGPADLFG
jgi:hypothetical protein